MTLKEFIWSRVQLFFFLVTVILAASVIIGVKFAPEQEIRYIDLLSPIVMAALCVLPTCVTYFRKEPTVGQYILRHIIQLALIEGVVVLLLSPPREGNKPLFYGLLVISVLVIYALAMLMMWLGKYRESAALTEQLRRMQQGQEDQTSGR